MQVANHTDVEVGLISSKKFTLKILFLSSNQGVLVTSTPSTQFGSYSFPAIFPYSFTNVFPSISSFLLLNANVPSSYKNT